MNERIRELAVNSGLLDAKYPADFQSIYNSQLEKFAELIVKECAKRVDYWESRQGEHSDDLLKHFGVEE
jgi:hypothetical protein